MSAASSSAPPYNVEPSDYASHLTAARQHDLVLWENHGWGVRSIGGEGDTLIWAAAYQLRSRRTGPFVKSEFSALQSMVAHVAYTEEQRAAMNDNDFIAHGWNGPDDLRPVEELEISVTEAETVWAMHNMRFIAAPPHWSVQGRLRQTEYDLQLHASTPAFWLTDRESSALEHGDRWHLVNAKCSGALALAGTRIPVDGMGWHERHIHLNGHYDPIKLLQGPGIVFHNGYSAAVDFHLMGRPALGVFRAKAICDGEAFDFAGPKEVESRELGHWIDPRTRLHTPVRWRVRCASAAAAIELEVRAFARTFYLWNFLTGGVNILYWWLAEASGRLDRPGRAPIEIKGMKHVVHQNQTLYRHP